MAITEKQVRRAGYTLERGAYHGTTDDRIDRWYWNDLESTVVDRRGPGFATKREALEAVELNLEGSTE